jgi:Arc/MetJ-type ribon-helix-helix transcriptional regulator
LHKVGKIHNKMKQKISISIEEDKIKKIEKLLDNSRFRNKSHLIEYSLEKFFKEELKE